MSRPSSTYMNEPRRSSQTQPRTDSFDRERRDSSSTFFGAGAPRGSTDYLRPEGLSSAGYNRQSYFRPPEREEPVRWGGDDEREHLQEKEEEQFDVYADFNNAGPRVVGALAQDTPANNRMSRAYSSYSTTKFVPPAPSPLRPPTSGLIDKIDPSSPMEYVTVPTLGPEWRADELREMSKAGQKESKTWERRRRFKAWWRDQEGLFGKWGTRKGLVIALFVLCCIVGILLAVLIPRVPGINLYGDTPFSALPNAPTPVFSRSPANFTFSAQIALEIDTSSQVALPVHFNSLTATIYDTDTMVAVGTGALYGVSAPSQQYTPVTMPLDFEYQAINASDPTWAAFRSACGPEWTGTTRPGLDLRLQIFMNIAGLTSSYQTAVSLASAPCPIVLPDNAP